MYSEANEQNRSTLKNRKLLNSDHMGAFVSVGDWKIHYYEVGEGPTLLLIHGIGQSLFTWHRVIDDLAQHFHVIAIDLPGHGYSSKLPMEYDIDGVSDLIVSTMDSLGLKRTDAIGFGTGAIYLLRAAQMHPKRFERLVLETPGGITPRVPFFIRALHTPMLSWLYKLMISPRVIRNLLNDCFFDQTLVDDTMVEEYYLPMSENEGRMPVVNALQNFDEETTMQSLRDLQHEVCLIWGADDRWHDLEIADQFNVSFRNGQLFVIRNCGHIVHEEKWERFIDISTSFLLAEDVLLARSSS